MFLSRKILEQKLLTFLAEDVGQGDLTTSLIVRDRMLVEAEVIAKQEGIVAGIEEAVTLIESLGLSAETLVKDGDAIKQKQTLIKIKGDARTLLSVERTLLNIISRMSGIATATRRIVEALEHAGLKTKVASTRKTAPGMLYFDKKAVWIGGGDTHRAHLDDMVLIKDNHIALAGSIEKALKSARRNVSFTKKIEIEVTDSQGALVASRAGADIIMLDNFAPKQIIRTIGILKKEKLRNGVVIEASGGINCENVLDFASTGVDVVSIGEITHSARSINVSLEITKKCGN